MADVMKRWEAAGPGIDALRLTDVPRPKPKADEALIRVSAVALNYRDASMLDGGLGADGWPQYPGIDMSGEVVAVGAAVTRFAPGDRVVSVDIADWIDGPAPQPTTNSLPFFGRLAEFAVVPAELLVMAPANLDPISASTLPVAGLTAWFAVVELGKVHAGQTIVVQGTGGVALFAVQFAAAHGADVIVISSGPEKLDRARALGATHGVDRSLIPDWHARVLELTGGIGADHVLEMAGGDITFSLRAIAMGGRISIIGLLADHELRAPIGLILFKRALLVGIGVGHRRAMEDMIRGVDHLGIAPVIDAIYPFDQVPAAFAHLKRGAFGKIVVSVGTRTPANSTRIRRYDPLIGL